MIGMKVDLPYLVEEKSRHGRWNIYVRKAGKRIRLRIMPGAPGFTEAYQAALAALEQKVSAGDKPQDGAFAPNSFGWLVRRYYVESVAFVRMKPAGRRRRRAVLDAMIEKHGDKPCIIPKENLAAGMAKRADRHGHANEWLKAMKALYSWANEAGVLSINPAAGIRKITVKTDGFHIWSLDEIAAFIKKHPLGTPAYLALMVLLFTGLRRSDAILLGRQHIRDGAIRFRTSKTDEELLTAVAGPLEAAMATRQECPAMTIIVTAHGRAFGSGSAFGNRMADWTRQAGIPHCTAHGLRKAGASIAAAEGASDIMLDAMFAWSQSGDTNQSRTYTRAASKLSLASRGFDLIADALVRAGIIAKARIRNAKRRT